VDNGVLADILEEMGQIFNIKGDRFRRQAYAKAADVVRKLPDPIISGASLKGVPGIGAGTIRRIDEILNTGELEELGDLKQDSQVIALRELRSVHGVGPSMCAELMRKKGVMSLKDLRAAVAGGTVHLNRVQMVGLRFAEEFSHKIPRAEVHEVEVALQKILSEHVPDGQITICGSYRRGKPLCGDIDCLLTSSAVTSDLPASAKGPLLRRYVEALRKSGLLVDDLAYGTSKYMGVCRLGPGRLHRRLDIRCIPHDQYFFGTLYFTGPRELSIELRLKAIEKGMVLNEYGLSNTTGFKVKATCERDIFEYLGVSYKEPTAR